MLANFAKKCWFSVSFLALLWSAYSGATLSGHKRKAICELSEYPDSRPSKRTIRLIPESLRKDIRAFDHDDLKSCPYIHALPRFYTANFDHILIARNTEDQTNTDFLEFARATRRDLITGVSETVGFVLLNVLDRGANQYSFNVGKKVLNATAVIYQSAVSCQSPLCPNIPNQYRSGLSRNSQRGVGGPSAIGYNPNAAVRRPDGDVRPPFITLIHEFIHAYRLQYGYGLPTRFADPVLNPIFFAGLTAAAMMEELETMGAVFSAVPFTENLMRPEYKVPSLVRVAPKRFVIIDAPLPLRASYSGYTANHAERELVFDYLLFQGNPY